MIFWLCIITRKSYFPERNFLRHYIQDIGIGRYLLKSGYKISEKSNARQGSLHALCLYQKQRQKIYQVRVGHAQEGFRTIIYGTFQVFSVLFVGS